jgi:hypothetical protein
MYSAKAVTGTQANDASSRPPIRRLNATLPRMKIPDLSKARPEQHLVAAPDERANDGAQCGNVKGTVSTWTGMNDA